MVLSTFAGRSPFSEPALALVGELVRIYGLDAPTPAKRLLGRGVLWARDLW